MSGRPDSRNVGRSGSSAERSADVTANALSLPALTCGMTVTAGRQAYCTSPWTSAVTAWPEDAYGMWTANELVLSLINSTPRCEIEPLPVEAKLNLPGFCFMAASQPLTESTFIEFEAAHTLGVVAANDTGTRSLKGSYGRLL